MTVGPPDGPENARAASASDASETARGTRLVFLGIVAFQISEYLYRFALARGLGVDGFGTFHQARAVLLLFAVVASVGLAPGVKRFVALKREAGRGAEARRSITEGSILAGVASVLGSAVLFALAGPLAALFHNPDLVGAIRILAFALPFLIGLEFVVRLGEAFRSFRPTVVAKQAVDPILRFAASAAFLAAGAGLSMILGVYAASAAVAFAVGLVLVLRLPSRRALPHGPAPAQAGPLLRFSLPLAFGGALFDLAERLDVLMIGFFADESQVGIYASGSALARGLLLFLSAAMPVAGTLAAEAAGRNAPGDVARLLRRTSRWALLFATPFAAGLFIYAPEALTILFGREYAPAAPSLRVLTCGYLLAVLAGPLGVLLNALGKTHWTLANMGLRTVVNVGLNFVLIPRFGIVGAAIATTFSIGLAAVVFRMQLRRLAPLGAIASGWGRPLLALALSIGTSLAVSAAVRTGIGGIADGAGDLGGASSVAGLVPAVAGGIVLLGVYALLLRGLPGCLREEDLDLFRRGPRSR